MKKSGKTIGLKINPLKQNICKPTFIYWGRLCPYKNINKSIRLFSKIHKIDKTSIPILQQIYEETEYQLKGFKTLENNITKTSVYVYFIINTPQK